MISTDTNIEMDLIAFHGYTLLKPEALLVNPTADTLRYDQIGGVMIFRNPDIHSQGHPVYRYSAKTLYITILYNTRKSVLSSARNPWSSVFKRMGLGDGCRWD